ncbi:MAG: hypothetical protein ACRCTA_03455, partial [Bacilli bacterium]
LTYGSITYAYNIKGATYIYFFIDLKVLGIIGVLKWCSIVLLLFIMINTIIIFINNYQYNKKIKELNYD